MESKTSPHSPPQPPSAQGFSPVNHKRWLHKGPQGFRVFISFQRYPQQPQERDEQPTKLPHHVSLPRPALLFFLSSSHPHSLPANRGFGGGRQSDSFSTETAPASTLSALTFPPLPKEVKRLSPILNITGLDPSASLWASS